MVASSRGIFTVVVLLVAGSEGDDSASFTAGLILAIQGKYRSGCVVLLTTNEKGDLTHQEGLVQVQLRKHLSQERVSVTARRIQSLNITALRCRKNIPLVVILNSDSDMKNELQEYSEKQNMAKAVWLMTLSVGSTEQYFTDINVPFNCEFFVARTGVSVTLSEVYRASKNKPVQTFYYGRWNNVSGLISDKPSIYIRRTDMEGVVLNVITADDPPILTIKDGGRNVSGFFGRVWNTLEGKMNFKTNYTVTEDMTKGQELKKDDCTGMIGRLQCGEVDVALGAFSTSSYAEIDIKFTMPLIYTAYQVFIKKPKGKTTEWNAFLMPFQPRLWLVLVATMLFISLYLATFYNIGRRIGNEEAGGPELYSFYDSLLYIFGAFCQQGHDITPRSTSCRLVYITAYLTALVLLAAYSAALISSLTVSYSNLPFEDLEGILKNKRYKMGMVDKSEMFYTFSDEKEDGIFGEIYKKLMVQDPSNFPATTLDGLRRVCSMRYAFFATPESVMPLLGKLNCTIIPLPYKSYPISLAIAFRPDNPFREFISYRLRNLRDGGILHKLRIDNWSFLSESATKSSLVSVDLEAIAPLLILLTSSVVVSIAVMFLERGKSALSNRDSDSSKKKSRWERNSLRLQSTSKSLPYKKSSPSLFFWKLVPEKIIPPFQGWHE
ncbi:Ionotropic receptor 124 [Blattella germanica]|nr:Ionotropic receptor 124 [Blattella germanica]